MRLEHIWSYASVVFDFGAFRVLHSVLFESFIQHFLSPSSIDILLTIVLTRRLVLTSELSCLIVLVFLESLGQTTQRLMLRG